MIVFDIIIAYLIIVLIGFLSIGHLLDTHDFLPEKLLYEIGNLVSIITGVVYLYYRYRVDFSQLGFVRANIKRLLSWGITTGVVLGILNFPYSLFINEGEVPSNYFIDLQYGSHIVLLFLFLVVIIIPLFEELFFRGFVYRLVKTRYDISWGFAASAGLFWIAHSFYVPVIISGILYCYIYEKTNSVGTSFIAHAIRNLIWFSALYYQSLSAPL